MKLEDKLALVAILIMALIFSFSAFYTNEKLLVIMIMFGFVFLFLRRIFADV